MKNILIGILTILCGGLGYMQFGMPQPAQEPCPVCEEAAIEEEITEAEPERLDTDEIITLIEIHGISLSTPLEEVDEKLAAADFTCNKNDNTATTPDKTSQRISWDCKHNDYANTFFNLNASQGELKTLKRSGSADIEAMDNAVRRIDELKARMNSREGMKVLQSGNGLTFSLVYQNEEQQNFTTQFKLKYPAPQTPEDIAENGQNPGHMVATAAR